VLVEQEVEMYELQYKSKNEVCGVGKSEIAFHANGPTFCSQVILVLYDSPDGEIRTQDTSCSICEFCIRELTQNNASVIRLISACVSKWFFSMRIFMVVPMQSMSAIITQAGDTRAVIESCHVCHGR